jgi:hypothetical protein
MFSSITEVISIGLPAITIAIFLLMFSEFSTIEQKRGARQSSVYAGLCFLIVSIAQIIGSYFFTFTPHLEHTVGYEIIIESCSFIASLAFFIGVVLLFNLAMSLIYKPLFRF